MTSTRFLQTCLRHVLKNRRIFTAAVCFKPIPIQMPALSPTMEEGTIVKWLVAEGDTVEVGDAMCEVETDKAVVTMEANEDGTIAKILVPEGTSNVKISVLIAIMAEDGEDIKNAAKFVGDSALPVKEVLSQSSKEAIDTSVPFKASTKSNFQLSPAVRQTLQHYNLDSGQVSGTGPKGLILKGDVLKYISANNIKAQNHVKESSQPGHVPVKSTETKHAAKASSKQQQTSESDFVDIEMSNVRKIIAKRLTESKQQIPHAYSSVDCTLSKLVALRKELLEDGVKLSVNDFIIKAAARTLTEVPEVNSQLKDGAIEHIPTVDVSVAVATDGGLITPIIKNASSKGLSEIGAEIRELAGRAREGRLKPEEFQGGTFTISNLGMFGIREFTAVINPPQACIMAVGGTRLSSSPLPIDLDADNAITACKRSVENVMTVTMSSDARVVDDHLATQFLQTFKKNIENPLRLGLL